VSESPVLYEKADGGLAWITLNRPQALNAINMEMRDLLWETMQAVRDDPDVRVAVFRGAGERAFSVGADITEFGTAPSYIESRRARHERDLWRLMLTLEKPLIAAIHGYALGAGIELPMCCDIRIGVPGEIAGRIGSVAASIVLETLGPQPQRYGADEFVARYARAFGDDPRLERLFSEPDPAS